ncbi:LysR family transcriptional regulator [Ahrensia marina]|uniref:LysR family transcriptional regulator n=1 Tax=Ahrensia marina TaxID=1514904 RepID=UPI0035CF1307
MRLEWLEDILAVADTGSFTEAADRRHLTPSAFSRRIQQIEEHLGVELFDRTRKPIQLKPTTDENKDEIAKLVGNLRQLATDLQRSSRLSGNRLVIASQHALTAAFTPRLLQVVQSRHSELYVRLRSANLDDCFSLLLARHADLAILYQVPDQKLDQSADFLQTRTIGKDTLVPVFSAANKALLNEHFSSGQLPIIAYPNDVFLGQVMDRTILPRVRSLADAVPRVETALTLAALEFAVSAIGVAWVPLSLARKELASGSLHDLSATLPSCDLTITAARLNDETTKSEDLMWTLLESLPIDGAEAKCGTMPGPVQSA